MSTSKEVIEALEKENFDLVAKVIHLIETYPGWCADDTYTFPDGDRWSKFDPTGEQSEKVHRE